VINVDMREFFDREAADLRVKRVKAEIFDAKLENQKHKQDVKSYVKELQRLHAWVDEFSKRFTVPSFRPEE
jgi:hypothetical protein